MKETTEQYVERLTGLVGGREPREILRNTPSTIEELITARPDTDLRWTTAPERWSVAAILAHLADAEIVSAYRVRMILASPGTPIQAFDQDQWAAAFHYGDRDPFASLTLFRSLRTAWLSLLEVVDDRWLDRYGVHQERGQESVRHLLQLYAGHDLNHLSQVERLLAELDGTRPVKP
ncbi:MAG: DinB family protein [Acidobacteriota bacterium]